MNSNTGTQAETTEQMISINYIPFLPILATDIGIITYIVKSG
jgi:hypothetical protein